MLNEALFDFSKETNLKERLWEKMLQIVEIKNPAREAISFDDLGGIGSPPPKTAINNGLSVSKHNGGKSI